MAFLQLFVLRREARSSARPVASIHYNNALVNFPFYCVAGSSGAPFFVFARGIPRIFKQRYPFEKLSPGLVLESISASTVALRLPFFFDPKLLSEVTLILLELGQAASLYFSGDFRLSTNYFCCTRRWDSRTASLFFFHMRRNFGWLPRFRGRGGASGLS